MIDVFLFWLLSLLAVELFLASLLKSISVYSQILSEPVPLVTDELSIPVPSPAHGSI